MKHNFKNTKKQQHEKSTYTTLEVVALVLSFCLLTAVITGYGVNIYKNYNLGYEEGIKDIINTYDKIVNNYYKEIDKENLADSAIDGMMRFLNEKYSIYLNNEETSDLNEKLNGDYEGIGISIIASDGKIVVYEVYPNTPAYNVGLKEKDIIIQVNDLVIKEDTDTSLLVNLIRNSNKIKMKVLRDDKEKTFDIEVKKLMVPVVSTKVYEKNGKKTGYLSLSRFTNNADVQMKNSLISLEKQEISSLILDLRDNTGGYLDVTKNIASLFLKKGKIIYQLDNKKEKKIIYDDTLEERRYPIIVLINKNTASASEILASALKESYGAIIMGDKSFGKGLVQQTSSLSNSTMIKYTSAKWYTPFGNSINGIGIIPGISIEMDKKYYKNPSEIYDNQLQSALRLTFE